MTKLGKVCLVLGLMAVISILNVVVGAGSVHAADRSWLAAPPKLLSFVPDNTLPSCTGTTLTATVDGVGKQLPICLTDEEPTSGLRWGYYLNYDRPQPIISFSHEVKFYPITSLTYAPRAAHYDAASDTLILGNVAANGRLTVYQNVTKRLKRQTYVAQTYFEFDNTVPDYVSKLQIVGPIGVSNNGRYVAFEIREGGIGLLDRQTKVIKRISIQIVHYGWGNDPSSEFAVSNDGKLVAEAGFNMPFNVFAVDDNCGTPLEPGSIAPPLLADCPTVELPLGDFLTTVSVFYAPSFNDDATLFSFYMNSLDGHSGYVTLADGYTGQKLDYLALGDSYTSGEGESNDSFYVDGTNTDIEKCHLSLRSYPFLYGLSLGLPSDQVHSVACSGAKTSDIVGGDDNYWGQGKRLGSGGFNLNNVDRLAYQAQALSDFTPGRVHQLSFVTKYAPSLITLGIGGNDSGLFGKLAACAMPNECEWVNDKGRAQTYTEINGLKDELIRTYRAVRASSPASKLYIVNYPEVINSAGICDPLTAAMFTKAERQLIAQSIIRINDVINQAATSVGIGVLDITNAFTGHRLCDGSSQTAINSLYLGDDFGPGSSKWTRLLGNETFHPTPYGQTLIANSLYKQLSHIDDQTANCSECERAAEPGYWPSDEQAATYAISHNVDLTTTSRIDDKAIPLVISLPEASLAAASSATLNVDGSPLLTSVVEADGSLKANLQLPGDLGEGVHTIHVEGETPSGAAIDDYDMVSYSQVSTDDNRGLGGNSEADGGAGIEADKQTNQGSESASVAGVNPSNIPQSYNPFRGILPWGWRLPVDALKPLSRQAGSPQIGYLSSTEQLLQKYQGNHSEKSRTDSKKTDASVLGWRSQQRLSWLNWLFGPIALCNSFQLASLGQPGIMSPWLIFALL